MGVIQRQGIKFSIVNYVGLFIGIINIFIYQKAYEQYGLLNFLTNTAAFLAPFMLLGSHGLAIRFFPQFQNKKLDNNGLLGFLLLWCLAGLGLFVTVYWLWGQQFLPSLRWVGINPDLFQTYDKTIGILSACVLVQTLLQFYTTNFNRIVIPSVLYEVLIKLTMPLLILLFVNQLIDTKGLTLGLVIHFSLITALGLIYLWSIGGLNLKLNRAAYPKPVLKEMAQYAGYVSIGGLGTVLALRMDTILVSAMIGLVENGIYSIIGLVAQTIEIPSRAIVRISGPIIAQAYQKGETGEVKKLYKQSSLLLLTLGLYTFIGVWACTDDIFKMMKNGDALIAGKNIMLFLGLGRIVESSFNLNNQILQLSPYFRWTFISVLLLGVFAVSFNLMLIPAFQLTGAAMGMCLALVLFNLIKVGIIAIKLRFHPFSWKMALVIGIAVISWLILELLPFPAWPPLILVLFKGILLTAFYFGIILSFRIVPELNQLLAASFAKIKKD